VPNATPLNVVLASSKRAPLTDAEFWRMLHSTCSALEAMRAVKLLHGDIRPQNLLVLADHSVVLQHVLVRDNASLAGDKKYMAPDLVGALQGTAKASLDQLLANEVWALAATFYELCNGGRCLIVVNDKASASLIIKRLAQLEPFPVGTRLYAGHEQLNRILLDMFTFSPSQRPRPAELVQRLDKFRAEHAALFSGRKSAAAAAPAQASAAAAVSSSSSKKRKSATTSSAPPPGSLLAFDASPEEPSSDDALALSQPKKQTSVTFCAPKADDVSTASTASTRSRSTKRSADADSSPAPILLASGAPPVAHAELPAVKASRSGSRSSGGRSDVKEVPYGAVNARGIIRLARRDRFAAAFVGVRGANAPAWMVEAERVRDIGVVADRAARGEAPANAGKLDVLADGAPEDLESRTVLTADDFLIAPPALLARVANQQNHVGKKPTKQAIRQALAATSAAIYASGGAGTPTTAPVTACIRLYVPRDQSGEQITLQQLQQQQQAQAQAQQHQQHQQQQQQQKQQQQQQQQQKQQKQKSAQQQQQLQRQRELLQQQEWQQLAIDIKTGMTAMAAVASPASVQTASTRRK
jgi:hypothetical protein